MFTTFAGVAGSETGIRWHGAAFEPIVAGNPADVVAAPKIDREIRDLMR